MVAFLVLFSVYLCSKFLVGGVHASKKLYWGKMQQLFDRLPMHLVLGI